MAANDNYKNKTKSSTLSKTQKIQPQEHIRSHDWILHHHH